MSPFSRYLRHLRKLRGLRQNQLALLLGYEPSYLSALERSEKGPPRKEFISRLVRGLRLDEEEQAQLNRALQASRRQISLPAKASEQEYELLHLLEPQLGQLHPLQIQLIGQILSIPNMYSSTNAGATSGGMPQAPASMEAPKM